MAVDFGSLESGLAGALITLAAVAVIGAVFLVRLRRHLQKNLESAVGQQLGLSRQITEIIIQLQQNQQKQDEQIKQLAEFSLGVKRELKLLAERQANSDADLLLKSDDKPHFLN